MRLTYRRIALGLLVAGFAGSAASGLQTSPGPAPLDAATEPPLIPVMLLAVAAPAPADAPAVVHAVRLVAIDPPRDTPAVALDWAGPSSVKIGRKTDYTLTVKNASSQPLQKVVVQVRVPKTAEISATKPPAKDVDGVKLWELGTLDVAAAKTLTVTLAAAARGDIGCQAWVTFTGTAGMTVAVKEPKLEVTATAPARVPVGEVFTLTGTVRNVGDCDFARVVRSAGLTGRAEMFASKEPLAVGGDQRHAYEFKPAAGGDHEYTFNATADDGTTATATAKVHVMVPKLTAAVTGPAEILVGRKAKYTVRVTNAGELPVENVTAMVTADPRLTSAGPLAIPVAKLAPGETSETVVVYPAAATGPAGVNVAVKGSRGTTAAAECRTTIDGVPAMRMEVADLADPVEKGGETTYEIRVVNTGSKADADVKLTCRLPKELEFVAATGPVGHAAVPAGGREITFDAVTELAPKTEAVFRVRVKALAPGDVRFTAAITSRHLATPVTKEESTRVYGD